MAIYGTEKEIEKLTKNLRKMNGYEELVHELTTLPITWYPALIIEMVEAAYQNEVFVPGGASHLIQGVEEKIGHAKKGEKK